MVVNTVVYDFRRCGQCAQPEVGQLEHEPSVDQAIARPQFPVHAHLAAMQERHALHSQKTTVGIDKTGKHHNDTGDKPEGWSFGSLRVQTYP